MTTLAKEIIREIESGLDSLPEIEQDRAAVELRKQWRATQAQGKDKASKTAEPYSSFKILQEANLEGLPEDYSVTYERALYGREHDLDA